MLLKIWRLEVWKFGSLEVLLSLFWKFGVFSFGDYGRYRYRYHCRDGDFQFHAEIEGDSEEPAIEPAIEPADDEEFVLGHPELETKSWLGWRISYRTTAPEAKTFESFRPRLRKIIEAMGSKLICGAQRHRRSSVVIGNFARNAAKKIARQKARAKVLYLHVLGLTKLMKPFVNICKWPIFKFM